MKKTENTYFYNKCENDIFNPEYFEKLNNEDKKIYLDNVNLEVSYNNDSWKPIHYICACSTSEMIKHIIDKGVDLECKTNNNWKPVHLICKMFYTKND